LLKTFWTGAGGWADQQLPDATIIWTAPTGKTYTTHPGSRIFFPKWNCAAPNPPPPTTPATTANSRGLMMPTRRRTRTADVAHRIRTERALNDTRVAERNKPPPF